MPTDSNLSKFDQLHETLTSLEQEKNRLHFLYDMACSYLSFEQKEFLKTLKSLDIDAAQWCEIANLFDRLQNGLIPGHRTFSSDDLSDPLHEIGLGFEGVDALVVDLYFTGQWSDVCYQYAKGFGNNPHYGLGDIIKDYEKQIGTEYHL